MKLYPESVDNLIARLAKLPGIGRKSAARLAFYILTLPDADAKALADAITTAKSATRFCERCQNLTDAPLCAVCRDGTRDDTTVCVVAESRDVAAIERTREFKGLYHVLHGVLSPMNRVGPEQIKIRELIARLGDGVIDEVIMATNPDAEGDATAMYIARTLKPMGIRVTRLAYGMPLGGALQYADEMTLTHAITGRREL